MPTTLAGPHTIAARLIRAHPRNPNIMSDRTRDRIKRSIVKRGRYPRLILRSLEDSTEFEGDYQAGFYQLLDGEHRLHILADLGFEEVDVDIWPGISDATADVYLAGLNHGGEDDPERRGELLAKLLERVENDVAALVDEVPETLEQLKGQLKLTAGERRAVSFQAGVGRGSDQIPQSGAVCLRVFLPDKTAEKAIRLKINEWLKANDPQSKLPYREGMALRALLGSV